ncbi:MAG: hypothetical protein L0Y64_25905 [Myxococcaceae bacterium]|nr:hypothetical protein [Myxococcaceae bacterium]
MRRTAVVTGCMGLLALAGCRAPEGVSPCADLETSQCAAPSGLVECLGLQGRFDANFFRAVPLGGTGVPVTFSNSDFSVMVSGDRFESRFLAPGEPVVERAGRVFIRAQRVEFDDEPLFPRTAAGLQSFRCGQAEDGLLYLRTDALGFDFDGDGTFEPALIELNLVPAPP